MVESQENIPRPDPTGRTREDLHREIDNVYRTAKSWIDALQLLMESRFNGMDKAVSLKAEELEGRLEVLNNDRREARDKENSFVQSEAFDSFRTRVLDDFITVRKDLVTAFDRATSVRDDSARVLNESQSKQNSMNDARFVSLEAVQSKMIGAMIFVGALIPIIAGVLIYLMSHGAP
jgi:hypothetical protein